MDPVIDSEFYRKLI